MSESWQDWSSEEYQEFLKRFYGKQIQFADEVVQYALGKPYTSAMVAVFGKVAPPAVYLKAEYDKWRRSKRTSKPKDTSFVEPPQSDKWIETKTKGTYRCSERDATDEELAKAKDSKDRSMWYSKPGEGYRWGLVFKKVKA